MLDEIISYYLYHEKEIDYGMLLISFCQYIRTK
jgi:hypothetical protein